MRLFPAQTLAALALATALFAASSSLAATADTATPAPPQAASPAAVQPAAQPGDADTPPPFISRPRRAPQPVRTDMTYASRPAPRGFRGLDWGASLDKATAALGLKPVTSPRPLPGTFQRLDELLKVGQADVRTVAYYFPKGVFIGAGIMFEGEANFFLIKDHLIELYGPGRQVADHYGWTWENISIDLRLKNGMGELRYNYEAPIKK